LGQLFFTHLGCGVGMMGGGEDDRSMNVSKNNYSIIINIYSINIQSYISYHYPLPPLGGKKCIVLCHNCHADENIPQIKFGVLPA
jgi:hypothetical protein